MLNNSELEALGVDGNAYWHAYTQRTSIDKTDAANRQDLKTQYQNAIDALNLIIAGTPGNDKTLAIILKRLLLYLKSEII